MTLFNLFRTDPSADLPHRLYRIAGEHARLPVFYTRLRVADSFDGRFDLLVLHVHLLIRRLGREQPDGKRRAQAVFDVMLSDLDQGLRIAGVGDVGIGKRVKKMSHAYYGRAIAYDAALDNDDRAMLEAAVRRNVYRGDPGAGIAPSALADYAWQAWAALLATGRADLDEARFAFPLPETEALP